MSKDQTLTRKRKLYEQGSNINTRKGKLYEQR